MVLHLKYSSESVRQLASALFAPASASCVNRPSRASSGEDGRWRGFCGGMINITSAKPRSFKPNAKIRKWVEQALPAEYEDVTVMVNELQCFEPGCAPVETVISLLDPGKPIVFKIFFPIAEVAESPPDQVLEALQLALKGSAPAHKNTTSSDTSSGSEDHKTAGKPAGEESGGPSAAAEEAVGEACEVAEEAVVEACEAAEEEACGAAGEASEAAEQVGRLGLEDAGQSQ